MDFFHRQDVAKRRTTILIVYFAVCVVLIIASVFISVKVIHHIYYSQNPQMAASDPFSVRWWWDPNLLTIVASITLAVIILGSLYKVSRLSTGGKAIAETLGGKPVSPNTKDPKERQLLNIVEEISIASGTPVPSVYLLDEEGINAFAAGYDPGSAVIGVTKGCVNTLSRDELQGVIAHEFSHILTGDMRLNIRLMGFLFGILVIAIIGRVLMRTRGRKNPLPLLGILLFVIGYVGIFFGHLIKAAISRQREFFADAAAIQFTRNGDGLAGALKKIGGLSAGSRIGHVKAEEASHFYFANGLKPAFFNWMSTHPPLEERIKAIDTSFDGNFPEITIRKGAGVGSFAVDPEDVTSSIGSPNHMHLAYAASLLTSIPAVVTSGLSEATGATAVIYAILLSSDAGAEKAQLSGMLERTDPETHKRIQDFAPRVRSLGPEARLPLVDMAIPALRGLSEKQYDAFHENVRFMADADKKRDVFEFALLKIISKHLNSHFKGARPPRSKHETLLHLQRECAVLLSALAHVGSQDAAGAAKAFDDGWARLKIKGMAGILPAEESTLEDLDKALDALVLVSFKLKKALLEACVACVSLDGKVTVEEAELIRAIADVFDSPMPPILK